jgi:hypothetical protein
MVDFEMWWIKNEALSNGQPILSFGNKIMSLVYAENSDEIGCAHHMFMCD